MTEKVWIALIVAATVVLVVIVLRRQIKRLVLKGAGASAELETHTDSPPAGARAAGKRASVNISGFKQTGVRNKLKVARDDVNIEGSKQVGFDQEIVVDSENESQS